MTAPLESRRISPRFRRWFSLYSHRLLNRSFNALRITRDGADTLRDAHQHHGPVIAAANHPAWWDPLLGLKLADEFMPGRPIAAPIDLEQYHRFRFFGKLGLFGLDPQHPQARSAMTQHISQRVNDEPRSLIMITPQGYFTDVRKPIVVRPGVGSLASTLTEARLICLAFEYTFWFDRRPEALVHAMTCEPPTANRTGAWRRAVQHRMQQAADHLASLARQQDAAHFIEFGATSGPAVNPAYDAWLRVRGRSARINPRRPIPADTPPETSA